MHMLRTTAKAISVVTVAEMRAGARVAGWGEQRWATLEHTLRAYVTFTIDDEIADHWSRLWAACRARGANVADNDLWIAATAIRLDLPVATLDSDFHRIPGVRTIDETGTDQVKP